MAAAIGVLALGAGNTASMLQGLRNARADAFPIDCAAQLVDVDAIVFPGVAHFGFVAAALDERGLREPLLDAIRIGVPFLGVCAGFQLLFEGSEEAAGVPGLGIFRGIVRRLSGPRSPHMGWNRVCGIAGSAVVEDGWAYFANSYAADASSEEVVAVSTYGQPFACAAKRDAVVGVQFHPERSGRYGERFLRRFVRLAGERRCLQNA